MNLYVVYLGGGLTAGRMGEDHEVVIVTGADENDAKTRAKAKWRGQGDAHVDALQRIDRIDGWEIILRAHADAATSD